MRAEAEGERRMMGCAAREGFWLSERDGLLGGAAVDDFLVMNTMPFFRTPEKSCRHTVNKGRVLGGKASTAYRELMSSQD